MKKRDFEELLHTAIHWTLTYVLYSGETVRFTMLKHYINTPIWRWTNKNNIFPFLFSELQRSSCGNPGVPPKGILYGTRFNVGDKIRYSCVSGYVLDGHPQLTCVTNAGNAAVWDFPVPICRGKHWAVYVTVYVIAAWWDVQYIPAFVSLLVCVFSPVAYSPLWF